MTAGSAAPATTAAPRASIADSLSGRDNALNFVRLVLASLVIVGHAWPLGGYGEGPQIGLGAVAVNGFFAISGYLIAGSRVRLTFLQYLWRRTLRIFPALWVCLLVIAFLISPLAAVAQCERWVAASAVEYVAKNAGLWIGQGGIDETLRAVPALVAWNGSQWTLSYEFAAYVVAGLVLSVPFVRRRTTWLFALFLLALVVQAAAPLLGVSAGIWLAGLRLAAFFAAGMALWSVSSKLPANTYVGLACAVLVVAVGQMALAPVVVNTVTPLPMAYAVLWLGGTLTVRIGSVNDVSYGVYIYAWPVQQLLAALDLHTVGVVGYALLAWVVTFPLALASWHFVEKPAMNLRRLVPSQHPGLAIEQVTLEE